MSRVEMSRRPAPPPSPSPYPQLRTLLLVLVGFFVLPAVLFFRLAGAEEAGARMAVMILALTLPATGALILRLNPDLLPDRQGLRRLQPLEWVNLLALLALLLTGVWWLAGALL